MDLAANLSQTVYQLPNADLPGRILVELSPFALQMKYFHKILMPYAWTVAIDLAIIFALFKHRKFALILHSVLAFVISLTTISTALSILIPTGFLKEEDRKFNQRHQILGVITLSLMVLQIICGVASRAIQFFGEKNSTVIYKLNFIHRYVAYPLLILGKVASYLKMKNKPFFAPILASDIALIVIYLVLKFTKTTMSSKIVPHNVQTDCKSVKSLAELKPTFSNLCIFANYIYDITPLKRFHPVGSKIIDSIKNRELDRYMYGMYRSQREPNIPTNDHGHKAFNLLGKPVGKLDIQSVYTGLESDYVQVALAKVQAISSQGKIYEIQLVSKGTRDILYRGYQTVDQLGRFFSLTLDDKITRLYTTVGFLTDANVTFMREEYFDDFDNDIASINGSMSTDSTLSLPMVTEGDRRTMKLLIKEYDNGKLTTKLVQEKYKNLKLSTSRGEGLKLGEIKEGKIVIVSGGTGFFPFCDLVDLLFKQLLIKKLPKLRRVILQNDPVLATNPFEKFTFEVFLSLNNIDEIHPLTLAQLNELTAEGSGFTLNLRISKQRDRIAKLNKHIRLQSERFTGAITKLIQSGEFERIWVCGPPPMNEELLSLFDKGSLPLEKYLIL